MISKTAVGVKPRRIITDDGKVTLGPSMIL